MQLDLLRGSEICEVGLYAGPEMEQTSRMQATDTEDKSPVESGGKIEEIDVGHGKRMQNDECGMMNGIQMPIFNSAFIILRSYVSSASS